MKIFLVFALTILFGCSPYAIPLKQSYVSSKQDFYHRPNAPTEKFAYEEWQSLALHENQRQWVENQKQMSQVKDSLGYTYTATDHGLRICAPRRAEHQARSLKVQTISIIAKIVSPIAKAFGNDSFLRVLEGENGCVTITGEDGLPYEKLSSVALCDKNGDIVMGSDHGVIVLRSGKFYYFSGLSWLPDNNVEYITCSELGSVYVKTKTGMAHIIPVIQDLLGKEHDFDNRMTCCYRRNGFVANSKNGVLCASDNDGLWTGLYVAAESFKYAKFHEDEAHKHASESLHALLFLETVTDTSGFFARAAVNIDEEAFERIDRNEWHQSQSQPGWFWKGDTSFDELVGHFFAYSIYYDLVADDSEKKEIRGVVNRIIDRMIAHNFNLVDADGKVTKWGRGNPEYKKTGLREHFGRGPIALSTLAIVEIAAHITERADLATIYQSLIEKNGYALDMYNAKILVPGFINHSDDELAFLSYYNLIRLEKNSDLKRLYLLSLDRYWHIMRPKRNPLWNFIYGAVSNNMCDTEQALQTLREFPTDLRNWRMENSQRTDITLNGKSHHGGIESKEVLPQSERAIERWNHNPYELDQGGDGSSTATDPTTWLLPYWLGKYHNLF